METAFIVFARDGQPHMVVTTSAKRSSFKPLKNAAKNIAKMFGEEYAGSAITKPELSVALDRGMTVEGPMPPSAVAGKIKKVRLEAAKQRKHLPVIPVSDVPLGDFGYDEFFDAVSFKASSFITERYKSTFNYEVKRVRALWDRSLSIPGTNRRGGWRCPPDTVGGGQITDRFGRNCGWGVARRLANAIAGIGQQAGTIGAPGEGRGSRRAQRRMRQLGGGPTRQQGGPVERGLRRVAERLQGDQTQAPSSAPVPRDPNTGQPVDEWAQYYEQPVAVPEPPSADEQIDDITERAGFLERNLRRIADRLSGGDRERRPRGLRAEARDTADEIPTPTADTVERTPRIAKPESETIREEPRRQRLNFDTGEVEDVVEEPVPQPSPVIEPPSPETPINYAALDFLRNNPWWSQNDEHRRAALREILSHDPELLAAVMRMYDGMTDKNRETWVKNVLDYVTYTRGNSTVDNSGQFDEVFGDSLKATLSRYAEFELKLRLAADKNFVIPPEAFEDERRQLEEELAAASARLKSMADNIAKDLAGVDLRGGDKIRLMQLAVRIAEAREKMRRLERMKDEDVLTPELRRALNSGIAPELAREITERIEQYPELQQNRFATHLLRKYGEDGQLPWDGMTPERWAAMTRDERYAYLGSAFGTTEIIGSQNGEKYSMEISEVASMTHIIDEGGVYDPEDYIENFGLNPSEADYDDFYVIEGLIRDEAGRVIGSFTRAVCVSSGRVAHELFKIDDPAHQGQGISETFNQTAFRHLQQIGVGTAVIKATGWDGPYVWGRVGYQTSTGDIGTPARDVLRTALIKYSNGEDSIIESDEQFALLQYLLADPSETLSHQAVIYALEGSNTSERRKRDVKNFISQNVPFRRGYLKFGEQNLKPDPRPRVRGENVDPNPDPVNVERDGERILQLRPARSLPENLQGMDVYSYPFQDVDRDEVRQDVKSRLGEEGFAPTSEILGNLTDSQLMEFANQLENRTRVAEMQATARVESLQERWSAHDNGESRPGVGQQLGAATALDELHALREAQRITNEEIMRRRREANRNNPVKPSEEHGSDLFESLRSGTFAGNDLADRLREIWGQLEFDDREELIGRGFRQPEAFRQNDPMVPQRESEIERDLQSYYDSLGPDDNYQDYEESPSYEMALENARSATILAAEMISRIKRTIDAGQEVTPQQVQDLASALKEVNERNAKRRMYPEIWKKILTANDPATIRERIGEEGLARVQQMSQNIRNAIAEYGDRQRRIAAQYFIERFGRSGRLPWEGMTPEKFRAMSSDERFAYVKAAFTHDRIVGKNGRTYRIEVTSINGYGSEYSIEGKIYDDYGDEIGEFKRGVSIASGQVYHSLFKINGEEHKGQDLNTIFAQTSYEFLSRIGIDHAHISSTGWDGPFVWGRVGFYGGDIGPNARRKLASDLRRFRATGDTSGVIKNEDQANFFELLLARQDELTHQELIYALGYDGASREEKAKIKEWVIWNARFDEGDFDITRDPDADPRDVIDASYGERTATSDAESRSLEEAADKAIDETLPIVSTDKEASEQINALVRNIRRRGAYIGSDVNGERAYDAIQDHARAFTTSFGNVPRSSADWQNMSDEELVAEHSRLAERIALDEQEVLRRLRIEDDWKDGNITRTLVDTVGLGISRIQFSRDELESSRKELERRRTLRKAELRNEMIANAQVSSVLDTRDADGNRILSREVEDSFAALPQGSGQTLQRFVDNHGVDTFIDDAWGRYVHDDLTVLSDKTLDEINEEIAQVDEEIATYLRQMESRIAALAAVRRTTDPTESARAVRDFRDNMSNLLRAQYHRGVLVTARKRKESNVPDTTDVFPESRLADEFMAENLEYAELGQRVVVAAEVAETFEDISVNATTSAAALTSLFLLDEPRAQELQDRADLEGRVPRFTELLETYQDATRERIDSLNDSELEAFIEGLRQLVVVQRRMVGDNFEVFRERNDISALRNALWTNSQLRLRTAALEMSLRELDSRRNAQAEQDRKNGRTVASADVRSSATQADRRSASDQQASRSATRRPTDADEPIDGTQIQPPTQRITPDPEAKSPEQLRTVIGEMVDDYRQYQLAQLGLYLQERYGDGDTPWEDMTPERWEEMSEFDRQSYLEQLYGHEIIRGRNGKFYSVEVQIETDNEQFQDALLEAQGDVETAREDLFELESDLESVRQELEDTPEDDQAERERIEDTISDLEDKIRQAQENVQRYERSYSDLVDEGGDAKTFLVYGSVYEVDENGNRIRGQAQVAGFNRTVSSENGFVEHDSFYVDDDHQGSGIATIVNGHAFPGLEAIGIERALVSTGTDGPYVWGRMGFEDANPTERQLLRRRAEEALQRQIQMFRDGVDEITVGTFPDQRVERLAITTERQVKLLEAMMANGQTSRQAIIFILEDFPDDGSVEVNSTPRRIKDLLKGTYPLWRGEMRLSDHAGDARDVVRNLPPDQLRRAQRARGITPEPETPDVPEVGDVLNDDPDAKDAKGPEELRQIVRGLVEEYQEYQQAVVGVYLTDRYGDGDLPWAGITRAQFEAMSPSEQERLIESLWNHDLIIGRNGKRYKVVATASGNEDHESIVDQIDEMEDELVSSNDRRDEIESEVERIDDQIRELEDAQDEDEDIDNSDLIDELTERRGDLLVERDDIDNRIYDLEAEANDLRAQIGEAGWSVYGTIYEIDEEGRIIGRVANFDRGIDFDQDKVEHNSFFVNDSHKGAGLSTIVNGHAFLGLHQLGIREASVPITAEDGPYVWGRVGFDDSSDWKRDNAEEQLRQEIQDFRAGAEFTIVTSERQAKLLEAMMDGGMTSRQAVIFILESDGRDPSRDQKIKQWMTDNYKLSSGEQRLNGGDPRKTVSDAIMERVRPNAVRGREPDQVEVDVDVPEVREPETPPTIGGLGGDVPYTPLVSVGSQVPKLPDEMTAAIEETTKNLPELSRWLLTNVQEALGADSVAGRESVARLEARLATEMATAAADIAGGMSPEDAISNLQQRLGLTNYGISESQVVEEIGASIRGQLERIKRAQQMLQDVAQNGDRPTPPEMMEPRPPGPPGPPIPMSEYARRLIIDSLQRLTYSPNGSDGGLLGEYMYWSAIADSGLRGQLDALKTSLRPEPVFDADALDAASNLGQDAAQIVADRITEGRARRVKSVLGYLDESDSELPWERSFDEVDTDDPVAVRRAFLAMTDAQKQDYLTGLYYHFEIVGSNGRRYQVRPRVFMDDVYSEEIDDMVPGAGVVLEIWEVDEEGNDISKVGGGERTIYFGMGGETPRVTHQSLSVDHRNAGITTILNGFAFMGLEKIGIRHVDVATADDGPYVWARMGFSAGPVSQRQRQRFQAALRSFEQFGPNGLIQNANQYALVKALLADPDSEHIHFIFALSDPDDSPQRREFLKTWFIANAPIDWGTLDISREQSPEVMARAEELSRRNRSKSLRPKGRFFTYVLEAKAIVAMSQGIPGSGPYGPRISVKSGNSGRPRNSGLAYGDIRSAVLAKGLGKPIGGISEIDGDGDGFVTGPDGEDNIPAAAASAAQGLLAAARRGRLGEERNKKQDDKPSGPQNFDVEPTKLGSAADGGTPTTVNEETSMYDVLPSGEQFIRDATSQDVMGDGAEYADSDAARAEERAKRVLDAQVDHLYDEMDIITDALGRWLDDRGEPPTDEEIDDFIDGEFLRVATDFRNGRTPADDQDQFSGPATGRNNSEPDSIDDSIANVEAKIQLLVDKLQTSMDNPNAPRPRTEDASTLVDLLRQRQALRTLKGFYEQGREFLRGEAAKPRSEENRPRDPKEFRDRLPGRAELRDLGEKLRDAINAEIDARAERRDATVGEYILERHGDEAMFWQGISEEQFLAMSPMERLEALAELFTHPVIKGKNGKFYAVVPHLLEDLAYAQTSNRSNIKADIYEVDAEGNIIGADRVGMLERTFDLDDKVVSHDKFFIFGAEHKSAGIATTVNGYAMPAFKQFGFDSVELMPAAEGPYVWPLVGFRGRDYLTGDPVDIGQEEVEKLRMALDGYERLGATPEFRGLIRNDDEYLVIRALLEESRTVPLTHQELLFALGVKQGDTDRDEEVKRWMIANSSMTRAALDLRSADDPRDAVRRLATNDGGRTVVEPKPVATPTGRPTGVGIGGQTQTSDDIGRFGGDAGRTSALSAAADIALTEDARFMDSENPGMMRLPERASWRDTDNARSRRLDTLVGKYYDENGDLTDEGRQLNNAIKQYLGAAAGGRRRRVRGDDAPESPTSSGPEIKMPTYTDIADNHSEALPRLTEGTSFIAVPKGNMGIETPNDARAYKGPLSDVPDVFLYDAIEARTADRETMRDIAVEMNLRDPEGFLFALKQKFVTSLTSREDQLAEFTDDEKEFMRRLKESGATLIKAPLGSSGGVTDPVGYFLLTDIPAEMGRGYILKHPDSQNVDYEAGVPLSNYAEALGHTLAAATGFANTPPRLIPWSNSSPRLFIESGLNNSAKRVTGVGYEASATADPEARFANAMINAVMGVEDRHRGNALGFVDDGVMPIDFGAASFPRGDRDYFRWYVQNKFWMDQNPWGGFFTEAVDASEDELDATMERGKQRMAEALIRISERLEASLSAVDNLDRVYPGIDDATKERWRSNLLYTIQQMRDPRVVDSMMTAVKTYVSMQRAAKLPPPPPAEDSPR